MFLLQHTHTYTHTHTHTLVYVPIATHTHTRIHPYDDMPPETLVVALKGGGAVENSQK